MEAESFWNYGLFVMLNHQAQKICRTKHRQLIKFIKLVIDRIHQIQQNWMCRGQLRAIDIKEVQKKVKAEVIPVKAGALGTIMRIYCVRFLKAYIFSRMVSHHSMVKSMIILIKIY